MAKNNQNIITRTLACILVVIMAVTAVPFGGFCASAAGKAVKYGFYGQDGNNIQFALYADGTLEFSGTGKMTDHVEYDFWQENDELFPYASYKWVPDEDDPWDGVYSSDEVVKKIIINKGITSIGDYAFYDFNALTEVVIADTVTYIGKSAFERCYNLKSIQLPSKLTTVDSYAFFRTGLKEVTVPSSVKIIENNAFGYCGAYISDPEKVSGFTVKGYNNTAAQKYAKDNGFKFVSLDVHKHTVKSPKITKATFTKDGVSTGTCSGCKKTVKTVIYKVSYVKLSATKYAYNGKIHTPAVTVKDSKGKTLKLNTDYTVSYSSGRKYPGQYAVKITLKGNYSGTRTLYYSIVPATPTLQVSAGYGRAYLKWNKQAGVNGYVIYMATSKNGAYKRVAVAKSNAYTLLKLTKGRTYYFKVAAYKTVGSKNLYGSFSTAKAVKIK